MTGGDILRLALDAHAAGDQARVRDLVSATGKAVLNNPVMLQLRALASDNQADERALLHYAAAQSHGGDAGAFFNLGVVEQQVGDLDQALLHYEHALRIEPAHLGALNNLSDLLRRRGRSAYAWRCMEVYLGAGGDPRGLEIRIAKIADDCGLKSEAERWFAKACEYEAGNMAIAWERAMQQLRDEQFAQGWQGYEARRHIFPHEVLGVVSYAMPEWDGGDLSRRSLLVHKEQGLGDTIMFASFLADLPDARAGAGLHLAVQPPLTRLFIANFPKAQVWSSVSTAGCGSEEYQPWRTVSGPIDCHIPFGSLPACLGVGGFGSPRAYLRPVAADEQLWRQRMAALAPPSAGNLRAGLVISARRGGVVAPGIADGAAKTLPGQLTHPLEIDGVRWFGLHNHETAADLATLALAGLIDTSDWLFDLADTAALIAQLDVVVAVDTAVAHLAGAMGKKVLLMLRRLSDWRWGRDRSDSYWYPDVEIFRQTHEGDWASVVAAVAARLIALRDQASTQRQEIA